MPDKRDRRSDTKNFTVYIFHKKYAGFLLKKNKKYILSNRILPKQTKLLTWSMIDLRRSINKK